MSLHLGNILRKAAKKPRTREEILALEPAIEYKDGRTIQSHKNETDIVKIMARFHRGEAISHLAKYEGVYGDFAGFDFFEHTRKLTRGREIFDDLSAELRDEFRQSPERFFAWVNDPANRDKLAEKLPGLAAPGRQLDALTPASADLDAAKAIVKAAEDAAKPSPTAPTEAVPSPPAFTSDAQQAPSA